jgi:hypothetical protein
MLPAARGWHSSSALACCNMDTSRQGGSKVRASLHAAAAAGRVAVNIALENTRRHHVLGEDTATRT